MDTKNLIQEILNAIQKIVDPSFKYMMAISLKQVYVQIFYSIAWVFIFGLAAFIFFMAIKRMLKWKKEYEKKDYGERNDLDVEMEGAYPWGMGFGLFFLILCTVFSLMNLGDAIGKLLNPEWYAIKNIVDMIIISQ